MLGNVSINFLSHANFVQYDLILRSFLLVLFCFFFYSKEKEMHVLMFITFRRWELENGSSPVLTKVFNFLAAIFLPRVDATVLD